MSNIFIFANSFTARNILKNIAYILNFEIEEAYLLRENHILDEESLNLYGIKKLYLSNNINECIERSDYIFILHNVNTPQKSIDYILTKANTLNKRCIVLSDPWNKNSLSASNIESYKTLNSGNSPVILHIALGTLSQQFPVELLLSHIFIENKINFKHLYEQKTKEILKHFYEEGILKSEFSQQLTCSTVDNDVYIVSIDIGENIFNLKNYFMLWESLKADYIILQTDFDFYEISIAKNIIKYTNYCELGTLIKSHYSYINDNLAVYTRRDVNEQDIVCNLESALLEEKLTFDIFSNISLPEGVNTV